MFMQHICFQQCYEAFDRKFISQMIFYYSPDIFEIFVLNKFNNKFDKFAERYLRSNFFYFTNSKNLQYVHIREILKKNYILIEILHLFYKF